MGDGADLETSTTLLRRLRRAPDDVEAWSSFVDRYGRLVYRWCRAWGLGDQDAEDVAQDVLLELARQMRSFVYDPSGRFRAWLKTVAHRAWCRFVERRRIEGARAALDVVATPAAGEDFLTRLEREAERESMERAMAFVRSRVQPRTWEAFRLLAIEQRSGAEAAERLSMNVGAVWVARGKVQKMLRDELRRIDGDEPE